MVDGIFEFVRLPPLFIWLGCLVLMDFGFMLSAFFPLFSGAPVHLDVFLVFSLLAD